MALTVAQVWSRTRDSHPALSALSAPLVLGIRECSDYQRDLVRAVIDRVPAFFALRYTVPMPLADFAAGIDLGTAIAAGWLDLPTGRVVDGTGHWRPATFVPYEQQDICQRLPAYTLLNNTLFLLGVAGNYAQAASFVLEGTPIPADLTAGSSAFILPDDARETLKKMLAVFYLRRLVGNPMYQVTSDVVGEYAADAAHERDLWLDRIFNIARRQRHVMRDVGPRP